MAEQKVHDGMTFGLHSFEFAGQVIGLISDDSLDWGGDDRSTNKIWAAQKRNAPVKELTDNPGTEEIEGDLIELKPAELVKVMGGTADASGKKWDAPAEVVTKEGPAKIITADGTTIDIKRASLVAKPKGNLGYKDVFKIHFKLTVLAPNDDSSPYSFSTQEETPVA